MDFGIINQAVGMMGSKPEEMGAAQAASAPAAQPSYTSTVNQALEQTGSEYRVPEGVETAGKIAESVDTGEKNNLMNSGIVKLGKKVVGAVASFYTGGAAGAAMNVAGQQAGEAGGSAGKFTGLAGGVM